MQGTKTRVNNVDVTTPPTIATPIPVLVAEASLNPIAIGMVPAINARLVIRIGLNRLTDATTISLTKSASPTSSSRPFAVSIKSIEFLVATPSKSKIPIIE